MAAEEINPSASASTAASLPPIAEVIDALPDPVDDDDEEDTRDNVEPAVKSEREVQAERAKKEAKARIIKAEAGTQANTDS